MAFRQLRSPQSLISDYLLYWDDLGCRERVKLGLCVLMLEVTAWHHSLLFRDRWVRYKPLACKISENIRGMKSCSPLVVQVKALFAKALKDAFPSLQQDVGSPVDPSG